MLKFLLSLDGSGFFSCVSVFFSLVLSKLVTSSRFGLSDMIGCMLIRNKREYIFLFIFLAFLSTKALKSLGESEGCFAKTPRQWRSCNLLFIWRRFASHPVNVHDSATQHWTKPHPFWMASETAKMNIYITIAVPTLRLAYKRGANMMIQYDSFAYLFFSFSSFFFFASVKIWQIFAHSARFLSWAWSHVRSFRLDFTERDYIQEKTPPLYQPAHNAAVSFNALFTNHTL